MFQGVVFFRAPYKQPVLVQSVALLICLFVTQLQALLLPFVSMTLFIEDRKFFVRESASRLYSTSNYFFANALLELVLTTTCALIYGTPACLPACLRARFWGTQIDYQLTTPSS